jgi:hypothetical protein
MIVQTPLGEAGASPSQQPDKPTRRRTGNGGMDREMELLLIFAVRTGFRGDRPLRKTFDDLSGPTDAESTVIQ